MLLVGPLLRSITITACPLGTMVCMQERLPHPISGAEFTSPVTPGTGWPGDTADSETPVAHSAAEVAELAAAESWTELDSRISVCRACPRLVSWREEVAIKKRASFAQQPYWGRPVPGWGATNPSIVILGLAPAANGANRTGRMFTGDSSGDWLYASLYRCGLATQEGAVHSGDGQELLGTRIVASVKCAPPQNKPTTEERDNCAPWLLAEMQLCLPTTKVLVALGSFGWAAALRALRQMGLDVPKPQPKFGHAREVEIGPLVLLGSYHPSQHNTFTGRLTKEMMDEIFNRARVLAGIS
jgi:uracil-DNA glycosylase family 4